MNVITGRQCRMARALLNWRLRDLHQASKTAISTIRKIESFDGVPMARVDNLDSIYRAFVGTGKVQFIGDDTVRFINPDSDK